MPSATNPVKDALQVYASRLKASYSTAAKAASGGPEEQLKAHVMALLETCAHLAPKLGKTATTVLTIPESSIKGTGRPDVAVQLGGLLTGYVELKAPDKPADPTKLKDKHDKDQWKKFQLLPNLIYTNGLEWRLYRYDDTKPIIVKAVKLGEYIIGGAAAVTDADADSFAALIQVFYNWKVITPTSPEGLAALLAPLARLFRQEVSEALSIKGSNIENVRDSWKQTLFPEADDEQFTDIYAQTVTYALLLARLDGADVLNTAEAVQTLKSGHELLSSALKILTEDALKKELGSGLATLIRIISALDAKAFKAQEEKLWLYFYEHFLAAYDKNLRNKYGVYYTPVQVIGAQVRLVNEVLKTKLGIVHGFADENVIILDPAAGTGAYPLAVIEHALEEAKAYGAGMVPQVASRLATTTHAFEILVGPYAVAHLRISQAIQNAGGELPIDGTHVYLNNTLESPHATTPGGLSFHFKELTTEHARAQKVKLETAVMVTLGNPPYNQHEAKDTTRGGWVRYGDSGKDGIIEDFLRPAREANAGVYLKSLYNDYVYFWRWAMWKTFENSGTKDNPQPVPRPGVVCFITAASYLRGPGFIGMRETMRRTFDEIWILDLEGDNLGAHKTPNVFAIQIPVCIALGIKSEKNDSNKPATVRYAKITGDSREKKLEKLDNIRKLADVQWHECMSGWSDPLLPRGTGKYWEWPKLTDVFPTQRSGLEFQRSWPISESKSVLERRWTAFTETGLRERVNYFVENRDRKILHSYPDIKNSAIRLKPLISLNKTDVVGEIVRYGFRSFDRKWAILDNRLGNYLRPELCRSHSSKQIYLTSIFTELIGYGPAATVSSCLPDRHFFCGRNGGLIPLYLDAKATQTNTAPDLLNMLAAEYGAPVPGEDLFAYAYVMLSTPAYVEKYAEDLTVPGPRLPITRDGTLFTQAAKLGRELLNLHTYGERFAASGAATAYWGKVRCTKAIPITSAGYPDEFSYNDSTGTLKVGEGEFAPVSKAVFDYSVSGLQPLQSWIKYRLKKGYGKRSSPLDDIRPEVWTADMTYELMELISLLERTLELETQSTAFLEAAEAGACFTVDELPKPIKSNVEEEEESEDGEVIKLDFGI